MQEKRSNLPSPENRVPKDGELSDIIGRVDSSGNWWIARSDRTGFNSEQLGKWSPNVSWVDVSLGDFNDDGRDDLIGRVGTSGDWWVAESNGSAFGNAKWGRWSPKVDWDNVLVGAWPGRR